MSVPVALVRLACVALALMGVLLAITGAVRIGEARHWHDRADGVLHACGAVVAFAFALASIAFTFGA